MVSRAIVQKSASWKIGTFMSTTAWLQVKAQLLHLGEGMQVRSMYNYPIGYISHDGQMTLA